MSDDVAPDERHLTVPRTARYCTLGSPGPHVREVWLVCHGYGQLAGRFLRRFDVLDDGCRYLVAPEGLNRFYLDGSAGPHGPESRVGATWMTREDRLTEIDDYVRYLDTLHAHIFAQIDRAAVRLVALGFSQGVATVCRWANRTAHRIDHLIAWAGAPPPELALGPDTFRGARLTFVLGREDRWASDALVAKLATTLTATGLRHELVRFDGGHVIDRETLHRLGGTI